MEPDDVVAVARAARWELLGADAGFGERSATKWDSDKALAQWALQ